MAAVDAGATHVQGTVNGYGERTGNADLLTVVANLQLKKGLPLLEPHRLQESTRIAHAIAEVTNVPAYSRQPYVGSSAFAHKAGLHASAIKVDPDLYQHMDPKAVGNDMRMLVSDMAGRASIELKSRELGFDLDAADEDDHATLARVLRAVKERELRGYTFDAADASFELLLRRELDGVAAGVLRGRVVARHHRRPRRRRGAVRGDGQGASRRASAASDRARATARSTRSTTRCASALAASYPEIGHLELIDYKVRILDAAHGTDAVTRVLIETSDGTTSWTTIGVAANILEASWDALVESVTYGLVRAGVAPADRAPCRARPQAVAQDVRAVGERPPALQVGGLAQGSGWRE